MKLRLALILGTLTLFPASAVAGKIVAANDEWTLRDARWNDDAARFETNLVSWFGAQPGDKFLIGNTAFDDQFFNLLANGLGYAYDRIPLGVAPDLAMLQQYRAAFVSGPRWNPFDMVALTNYVKWGGNVYIAAGTGGGGPSGEGGAWNEFLTAFGLQYNSTYYNGIDAFIPIDSPHPIFSGVAALYQSNGLSVLLTDPAIPQARILVTYGGEGLYGVYESANAPAGAWAVPEPGGLLLAACGLVALAAVRRIMAPDSRG